MIKVFAPKPEALDDSKSLRKWTINEHENFLVSILDEHQIAVDTDEELKILCHDDIESIAKMRNMDFDSFYEDLKERYPYSQWSRWSYLSEQELKVYENHYRKVKRIKLR